MKAGDRIDIPHEGETWTIVRSSIESGGGDFISDVEIAAGKGPPFHVHVHEDEQIVITEGSVILQLPDGPRTIRAGESYTIPAGTRHAFKAGPDGFKGRGTYNGRRFEELVAQLVPGDKRGFVRMIQHARRTGWQGSRLTSPALRGVMAIVAGVGSLMGIRPRAV